MRRRSRSRASRRHCRFSCRRFRPMAIEKFPTSSPATSGGGLGWGQAAGEEHAPILSFPRYRRGRDARPCTRSHSLACVGLIAPLLLSACSRSSIDTAELLAPNSGGATTIHEVNRNAFSQPAANLDVERRGEFFIGNAFFNSAWIVAPATAGARDGLGPLFNARSCDQCHNNDGRGAPPLKPGERPVALVL